MTNVAAPVESDKTSIEEDTSETSSTTVSDQQLMRLVVLQASPEGCVYEDTDSPARVDLHVQRAGMQDSVLVENVFLKPDDFPVRLVQLAQRFEAGEIDCFVNLCDGAWDEPSCGMGVVDLLQNKLNLPFTGADLNFYEPTRLQMKKAALACGVLVPSWKFVYSQTELESWLQDFDCQDDAVKENASAPLNFPLIVKHFSSYSSVGLTKDSKVWNVKDLEIQCNRMLEMFGGCLVEEFIIGREFTVLVTEVPDDNDTGHSNAVAIKAFDPVECSFGKDEDFKHYNLKWVDYDSMCWTKVVDQDLAERLKEMGRMVFQVIRGRGYARLDVRSDASGEKLYFLEINPNCGVFYPPMEYGSGDFILDYTDPLHAHANFLIDQVETARRHWRSRRQESITFETRYNPTKQSWGLYALHDLSIGDVIQRNEEEPHFLVSRSHVMKQWQGAPANLIQSSHSKQDTIRTWSNFAAYCWPVSDDLFVMWDPDPDKWRPINHSCDPNAWNEEGCGLNLVARRPIRTGEEICMDYATFVGSFPEMKSFDCSCQSAGCRRVVTGVDIILREELAERYRGHTTSYVKAKIEQFRNDKPRNLKVQKSNHYQYMANDENKVKSYHLQSKCDDNNGVFSSFNGCHNDESEAKSGINVSNVNNISIGEKNMIDCYEFNDNDNTAADENDKNLYNGNTGCALDYNEPKVDDAKLFCEYEGSKMLLTTSATM